jgi:hypothetical protein
MADPREIPRFRPLARSGDGGFSYVLEGIIEVKLQAHSANLWGKPRSMDQMMAALLRYFLLGASILEVCIDMDQWMVLWWRGVLLLSRRWSVSVAWRNGVSTAGA